MKIMMHGFEAFKNKVIKEELRAVQNDAQMYVCTTKFSTVQPSTITLTACLRAGLFC